MIELENVIYLCIQSARQALAEFKLLGRFMYTGSCLCGEVGVEVSGSITSIIHCHCSLCRKNSGTAFATNGFVNIDDFTIIKGQALLSEFSFKPGRTRYFCKCCGSPVYSSNSDDKSRIRIRLGILDSDITEQVLSHNFVTSKANWEQLETSLPCYEKHEPSR